MRTLTAMLCLAFLVPGCVTVEVDATTAVTAAEESGSADPEPDSFGPDWQPTTSGPTSGEGDSTGSTGDASSTTDATSGTTGTTGEALPLDEPCGFSRPCEAGVCGPTGECVPSCEVDDRCLDGAWCLAGACVDVGSDMQEATVAEWNKSPEGAIDAADNDAWKMALPEPGSYEIKVHGAPISAFVIDGFGDVVAGPDDAMDAGDFVSYPAVISDSSLPISVLLMTASTEPVSYYWYVTKTP